MADTAPAPAPAPVEAPAPAPAPVEAPPAADSPRVAVVVTTPYHKKEAVNTAKYHPPVSTPRKTPFGQTMDFHPRMFKTEKWREQGVERWPPSAGDELNQRPSQFRKAQEVVPLQRRADEEQQPNVHSELWTRSLRMPGLHIQEHMGPANQNAFTSAVKCMFNEHGVGWTGKTNLGKKNIKTNPKLWVEKPVAVGKYSTLHMNGSRYIFDLSPRPCVPASMAHASKTM